VTAAPARFVDTPTAPPRPAPEAPARALLRAGHNCWRIEHAARLSFLVDGEAYFRAVREAITTARHSIFILGWDIDSRMRLVPDGARDGFPEPLGDFLNAVVAARRGLRACVLSWDFAMLYALEREWLPLYKLDARTHRRLTFRLDARHPVGASHHQKVIVVDDAVAFVGGFDLTQRRWDRSAHAGHEPLRRDPDGKAYGPFHDVQAIVDGDAARALGELCRDRWTRAGCGHAPPVRTSLEHDPWPRSCTVDVPDVDVAISRTEPTFEDSEGIGEIRQLHVDAIAAAEHYVFMENQYFSSNLIAESLAARLREASGPEFALVSHRSESGWLEASTMGVLRARLHRRLAAADAHHRFRAFCPELPDLTEGCCLNVHSKVLVVDDELLTIGSANLSNRSMGFDTECNLAIEARGQPRLRAAIGALRNRLLAEHLGCRATDVEAAMASTGSLFATIEALAGGDRTLGPLNPTVSPDVDALVPDAAVIDPERVLLSDEMVQELVPEQAERPVRGRLIALGVFVCAVALLAAAWRWTPLHNWLDVDALVAFADRIDDLPGTPALVLGAYVVAGLLVVPVTVLIAATGIVFGPVLGIVYALAGALLSGFVTYSLGRRLGRDTVRRLAGARLNAISRKLAERGLLAVVLVRLVPVAPFSIVNVVAGASQIHLRDFLLGTFLGLLPGVLGTVLFVDRIVASVRNPGPVTFALLAAVAGLLVGGTLVLRRRLTRRTPGRGRA
jgi:phospholipase D1/2